MGNPNITFLKGFPRGVLKAIPPLKNWASQTRGNFNRFNTGLKNHILTPIRGENYRPKSLLGTPGNPNLETRRP